MNVFIMCSLLIRITKVDSVTLTPRKFSRIFDDHREVFESCKQNNDNVIKTIETSFDVDSNQIYEEFRWDNKK